jgi:UDP-N-acetylmuramate: L-alanyl-gamma-D-glutamyl-meso-diaminopimelate ligase
LHFAADQYCPGIGLIVAGVDSPVVRELIPAAFSRVATVGIESGDWRARNIVQADEGMRFEVWNGDTSVGSFAIPMLGTFNVRNALDVIVTSKELGLSNDAIQAGLTSFKSVKRRLELRGEANRIRVYDDFAHHPTAVAETLTLCGSGIRRTGSGRSLSLGRKRVADEFSKTTSSKLSIKPIKLS